MYAPREPRSLRHSARARSDPSRFHNRAPIRLEALLVVRPRQVLVAGIARTDVACAAPSSTPSLGIQAPSGTGRRRQPAADSIVTQFAALARYVVAFGASHRPQPSIPRVDSHAGRGVCPAVDAADAGGRATRGSARETASVLVL
jgi:hypothetical protein